MNHHTPDLIDQPDTDDERRLGARVVMHNKWLLDLNAAVEHGAEPIDAAVAMLGAGANALADIVPREQALLILDEIRNKVARMPDRRGTVN